MRILIFVLWSIMIVSSARADSWMAGNDTTVNRKSHIKTCALTYSGSDQDAMSFIGRHYDVVINPNATWRSIISEENPNAKFIGYVLLSSVHGDSLDIDSFCTNRSLDDSMVYIWVETDSAAIDGAAPSGMTCRDSIIVTDAGEILQFCGWSSNRYALDFRNSETRAYVRWKAFHTMGNVWDGIMEDEAHYYKGANHMMFPIGNQSGHWVQGTSWENIVGWSGYTWQQVTDSMIKLRCDTAEGTGWMKAFCDTMYTEEKMYLMNITNYGIISTTTDQWHGVKEFGAGVWIFENSLSPITYSSYNDDAWEYMDSIVAWDTGYAVVWNTIMEAETTSLGGLERCQMERLTFYYMAANPDRFYFMLSGNSDNHLPNDYKVADTTWKWFPAIDYDIGTPDSARYVCSSGTDGASQSYNLYRRDYTRSDGKDVIMLYRKRNGTTYGATSAITYNLGGNYQKLNADGTLGGVVTSVDVRNIEGVIMVAQSAGEGGHTYQRQKKFIYKGVTQ